MSISGELDEPLLGFPLRRQGVGRNRANFRDPSRRPAIEQWPVERVIPARIGQHMHVRHIGSFESFYYGAVVRLSIRSAR